MTPQRKEEILMAAGRLAAEYLVSKGELPARVLHNRPPAPLPFQERRPAPRPQQHDLQRPFHEERPLAKQHFQFWPPAPRHFQQRTFAPRPFQGQGRPIAKRPRPPFQGRPPASHLGRPQGRPPFPSGQGAAIAAAAAGSLTKGDSNGTPAGNGSSSQPVAPSGGTGTAQSAQVVDQPNPG
jgi:hypothetical protein